MPQCYNGENPQQTVIGPNRGKHMVFMNSAGEDVLEDSTPNRYTIEVCDKRGISIGSQTAEIEMC